MENCTGWCTPLYVQFALYIFSIISIVFSATGQTSPSGKTKHAIVVTIVYALLGWLIFYLCKTCRNGWAWFVVLAPFILIIVLIVLIVLALQGQSKKPTETKKNGS